MENFYKKIRIRTDSKPRLMTAITALFYVCIGVSFASSINVGTVTALVSCLLCGYMASLVYAMLKGNILKAIGLCTLPFALGELLYFFDTSDVRSALIGVGMYVAFFGVGLMLGKAWYGKFINE